jgi:hypothetical protein
MVHEITGGCENVDCGIPSAFNKLREIERTHGGGKEKREHWQKWEIGN